MKQEKKYSNIPEVNFLLGEVEKKYGRQIATTTDFEALSVVIEQATDDRISASTLKRLWGYVSLAPVPRIATLDVLCRYLGVKDFKAYCQNLKDSKAFESTFFSSGNCVIAEDLPEGSAVTIAWAPNRQVSLKHLQGTSFEVTESHNSKLQVGDVFETASFIKGTPLFIARILRDGEFTPPFVAGKNGGITILES